MVIANELVFIGYSAVTALAATVASCWGVPGLTAYIALNGVLMNLMVTKQIMLCGWIATPSDALGIGTALGLNLIREYYTRQDAYRALRISFGAMGWYVIVSLFQLWYQPASCDTAHGHFEALLSPMPGILCASLIAYLVTETLEVYLYGAAHQLTQGRWFVARNIIVVGTTQLVDTILFSVLGLWHVVDSIYEIIVVSYIIKLATVVCMVPLIALTQRLKAHLSHVVSL